MGNQARRLASPRGSDRRSRAAPQTLSFLAACGILPAGGLLSACGILAGPADDVEIVVEAAHFRAPSSVRFEVRNHQAREVITVACDGVPRVYLLRREGGGWRHVHDSCPVDEGSFLEIGPGEVLRDSIDNLFPPGLYVMRFEFRLGREQVFPRSRRSKGFQITH